MGICIGSLTKEDRHLVEEEYDGVGSEDVVLASYMIWHNILQPLPQNWHLIRKSGLVPYDNMIVFKTISFA